MTRIKQIGFAVMFLMATSLLGASTADAAERTSTTLTCVAAETDLDFGASGTAKLGKVHRWYEPWWGGGSSDSVENSTSPARA